MPTPPVAGVTGIHHLTALASDAQRTVDFYTRLLGLRLVDLSVAEDDLSSYRMTFGDGEIGPGFLTLTERPGAPRAATGSAAPITWPSRQWTATRSGNGNAGSATTDCQ